MVDFRVPVYRSFPYRLTARHAKQRKIVGSGRKADAKLDFLARSPPPSVRRGGIKKKEKSTPKLNPSNELVSKEGRREEI